MVFQENETSFVGILPDCISIFHDSINHIVYCEEMITPKTSNYYEIKVLNRGKESLDVKKKSIEKKLFYEKTQQLNRYWKFPLQDQ